jgi:phage terminase small subunit
MALSYRQKRFVDEYLISGNLTQSAIKAGYSVNGAGVAGHRLLKNIRVKDALDVKQKALQAESDITKDSIVRNLWKEAKEADKPSDRINANVNLARILGYMKENPTVITGIFNQLDTQTQTIDTTVAPSSS